MLNLKRSVLTFSLLIAANVSFADENNSSTPPTTLDSPEMLANLPGSSFDTSVEMERKVQELKRLQLSPQQVNVIKQILIDQQRNTASPYATTAKPNTRSLGVSLNPGEVPPVIRLSAGMLSTIVFTDNAGNPWNIEKISLNRTLFNDGFSTNSSDNSSNESYVTNILSLEPLTPVAYGNVAITLKGLNTPIIFLLTTGQNDVDLRVDAKVPGISPDATYSSYSNYGANKITTTIDDMALRFVDGVPPPEAIPQKTTSNEIRAWQFGEDIIIRTNSPVLHPNYRTSVRASNGMTVYKFDSGTNYVTISKEGKPQTIMIEQP